MARTLSASDKDELAALLAKKKPTGADKERIAFLTADGPCVGCLDVSPILAPDDLADKNIGDAKAAS